MDYAVEEELIKGVVIQQGLVIGSETRKYKFNWLEAGVQNRIY